LIFFSPEIEFERCPKVYGNIVVVSDSLSVLNNSRIGTIDSGCGFNGSPGTPILFLSQSFECGLNGGSYGGRGGIGIGNNISASLECIRNSFSRMSSYGDPFNPIGSGATGSPFNYNKKVS